MMEEASHSLVDAIAQVALKTVSPYQERWATLDYRFFEVRSAITRTNFNLSFFVVVILTNNAQGDIFDENSEVERELPEILDS
jgi:hypothetical protein